MKIISNKLKPYLSLHIPVLMLGIFFLVLVGLFPFVRFTEEQIDIEVYPNHIWVEGFYTFKNPFPFPVSQSFKFPLPADKDHPEPCMLFAKQLNRSEKALPFVYILGTHRFRLKFDAHEQIKVVVKYRQQTPTKSARYILISTKAWKHPLNHGLYRVFLKDVGLTSSNYKLNQTDSVLLFRRENFMPLVDWIFSWEVS